MKKHWLVLVCCCGLAAASIGISINSSGVFYTPVSKKNIFNAYDIIFPCNCYDVIICSKNL